MYLEVSYPYVLTLSPESSSSATMKDEIKYTDTLHNMYV
jgi:hypothetical protein